MPKWCPTTCLADQCLLRSVFCSYNCSIVLWCMWTSDQSNTILYCSFWGFESIFQGGKFPRDGVFPVVYFLVRCLEYGGWKSFEGWFQTTVQAVWQLANIDIEGYQPQKSYVHYNQCLKLGLYKSGCPCRKLMLSKNKIIVQKP